MIWRPEWVQYQITNSSNANICPVGFSWNHFVGLERKSFSCCCCYFTIKCDRKYGLRILRIAFMDSFVVKSVPWAVFPRRHPQGAVILSSFVREKHIIVDSNSGQRPNLPLCIYQKKGNNEIAWRLHCSFVPPISRPVCHDQEQNFAWREIDLVHNLAGSKRSSFDLFSVMWYTQ